MPAPKAPPRVPPTVPPPVSKPPAPTPSGVEREISDLMSNISTYYSRKVSLLDLLRSGEVSERVFLKLYEEYSGRLNDLLNARVSRMEELRRQLEERDKRFDEVKLTLEELEVRHKIGELDDKTFSERAERLRAEEKSLEASVKALRANLDHLERLFSDMSPKEILNLEGRIRACYDSLDRLVEEKRISRETADKIKPDLEEALNLIDAIIGERKERERRLREQLEALHARYRVSEISIEEYERRKREIQEEIDKIWV